MDQNNQNNPNSSADNSDVYKQYQDILDRYSKELAASKPEIPTPPAPPTLVVPSDSTLSTEPLTTVSGITTTPVSTLSSEPEPVLAASTNSSPQFKSESNILPSLETPVIAASTTKEPTPPFLKPIASTETLYNTPVSAEETTNLNEQPPATLPVAESPLPLASTEFNNSSVNSNSASVPESSNNSPDSLSPPPTETSFNNSDLPLSEPPAPNNIFKYIFFISLILFLGVFGLLAYTMYANGQLSQFGQEAPILDNQVEPTPTLITSVCSVNDKTYPKGETFSAADGCNTCTCGDDLTISCTNLTCTATKSSSLTPTKTASTSAVPADWKTYANNTHNFSLRYPASWSINTNDAEQKENAKLVLSSGVYKIIIWSNLVGIGSGTKEVPSENIIISGLKLYKRDLGENVVEKSGSFEIASRPDSPTFVYLNKTYDISFEYPFMEKGNQSYKSNLEIFDQILSNFKFTQ